MNTRAPTRTQERIKEQVISAVVEARREFLAAAADVPEPISRQVFLGEWSLLDILAHLTGWDEANIEAVREVMAGELPSFYAFHSPDWRMFNANLVEKYRRGRFNDAIALAWASHHRLVETLRSVPAGAFNRDFGVRFRGYKVTLRRLMEADAKDSVEHLAQLVEFKAGLNA